MTKKYIILLTIICIPIVHFLYLTVSGISTAMERQAHHREQVYKDGYNCAGADIPVQANPYQEGTHLHTSWDRGWIAGKTKKVNLYDE